MLARRHEAPGPETLETFVLGSRELMRINSRLEDLLDWVLHGYSMRLSWLLLDLVLALTDDDELRTCLAQHDRLLAAQGPTERVQQLQARIWELAGPWTSPILAWLCTLADKKVIEFRGIVGSNDSDVEPALGFALWETTGLRSAST